MRSVAAAATRRGDTPHDTRSFRGVQRPLSFVIEENPLRITYPRTSSIDNPSLFSPAALGRRRLLRGLAALAAIAALALLVGLAGSATAQGTPTAAEVPANLVPPAGTVLLFELQARGVQIYACAAKPDDATAFVWTFKAPEADLFNARGELAGRHFAGPTWQGFDGSAVVGKTLEHADSPDPGSIPWLLLEAKEHAGSGVFSTITFVQRLNTAGGVAPTEGCDADHAGEEVREPYSATYAFSYPSAPADATPAA